MSMVTLFGTSAAASAGPVSASAQSTCLSQALCLYDGVGFTGAKYSVTSLNPSGTCVSLVDEGWGDRARSVVNTHGRSAAMFMNDDCLGGPYQVPANSSISDLGSFSPESVWVQR
ncbi:peptidase inhibitor family I36 protein [Micromonospora sp. WMMD1102]|uniref:peptidase inhibitor family I36 protein n=1 Tax=Micromonospora sp. WMMD1102 TaxID=3016105 RepID=UPI0024157084|nr:peptidase inhibitor family I36 protein [Micromonospora sp. WMMD1102]MDG4787873.1 peptidase inhibitor family I36 protein [Micromonospora sp. WMMD1102]